jgi:antibiotic biosynthesis monooxygenase (ABM) superfamily enzyme
MNKNQIIRIAQEAGYNPEDGGVFKFDNFDLERFAALVVAAERERIIEKNAPVIEQINARMKALEGAREQQ